ncbi:MAG: family 78 glycoside hydrolase catalytic domain [Clostridia bacterium]|nr:family 78 glycoside hydrolase catalytic domain [Clostridia bacterium]
MLFEGAKWIWVEDASLPDTYGEFYREFSWNGGPVSLFLSADSEYTLFLNGRFVESNRYADCEWYKTYEEIDLTPYLASGVNRMAVLVWYYGLDSQRYLRETAGLLFEIKAGEQTLAVSDGETLCRYSRAYRNGYQKWVTRQLGLSFLYDATKEDGWIKGRLCGFHPAVPVAKSCTPVARPIQRLVCDPFCRGRLVSQGDGVYVFDLGQESVGLLSLRFTAKAEQHLLISWGEDLDEDGRVCRKISYRDFSVEYVARAGENEYTHYMLRLGCRYLQVECGGELADLTCGLIPKRYPTERVTFSAGSAREGAIYELSVRTLELCMLEHYVDTPWREQALYAFDSRNQMLCGYYAFRDGNFAYARANLLLLSKGMRPDGLLALCFPCPLTLLTIPSFSLHYVLEVWEYISHSQDNTLGVEVYETLKRILAGFLARRSGGLVPRYPEEYWNFHEWTPYGAGKEPCADALLNCLLVMALRAFRDICDACALADPFVGEADAVAAAAHAAFYDREVGLVRLTADSATYTELANAYAVLSGTVKGQEAARVAAALAGGTLAPTMLSSRCFVYDALLAVDADGYREAILADIEARYGAMLDVGATSVFETEKGKADFSGAGSLCHGWSAMPVYYYHILLKDEQGNREEVQL